MGEMTGEQALEWVRDTWPTVWGVIESQRPTGKELHPHVATLPAVLDALVADNDALRAKVERLKAEQDAAPGDKPWWEEILGAHSARQALALQRKLFRELEDERDALREEVERLKEWREPHLKRIQPCGCILCICETEDQCNGCGATSCKKHANSIASIADDPTAVWEDHPLVRQLDEARAEVERLKTGGRSDVQ